MKVLYPKEFIETTKSDDLTAYIQYLEGKQTEAKEVLENAREFSLGEKVIAEIDSQLREILTISSLIESYMYIVVMNSLDKLSISELQSFFSNELAVLEEEVTRLHSEMEEARRGLTDVRNEIAEKDREDKEYYDLFKAKDTEDFFQELDYGEYLAKLLSNRSLEDLDEILKCILIDYRKRHGISLSEEYINKIVARVVDTLKKSKTILSYSKTAKDELVAKLEEAEEFYPKVQLEGTNILSAELDLIFELMKYDKCNTDFFRGLSVEMQDDIENKWYDSSVYRKLRDTYDSICLGEKQVSSVSLETRELEKSSSEKYGDLEKAYNKSRESLDRMRNSFLQNRDKMLTRLKRTLMSYVSSSVSLEDLDQAIGQYSVLRHTKHSELLAIVDAIGDREKLIAKAQSMLENEEYIRLFQELDVTNLVRVLKAFGVDYSEDSVSPLVEVEARRLNQANIIIDMQRSMEYIKRCMDKMKRESNIFTRLRSAYNQKIEEYKEQYHKRMIEGLDRLRDFNLLEVKGPFFNFNKPSSWDDLVPVVPKKDTTVINSFDDIFLVEQEFWDFSTGLSEEETARLEEALSIEDWTAESKVLREEQRVLYKKLFSCSKDAEGFYEFRLDDNERSRLASLQGYICSITEEIKNIYLSRRIYMDGTARVNAYNYSDELQELRNLLGDGVAPSKQALNNFISQKKEEIAELERKLASQRCLCEGFGIEVPEVDDEIADESVDLNEGIRRLGIAGVSTYEEAVSYRDVVRGLSDFTIYPKDDNQVKSFYISAIGK